MARIHRLKHVERLRPTDLTHDDPVRTHAERVPDEVANRDLAFALDVGWARLETERVALPQPELRSVFDRHDPVRVRNRLRHGIEQCGLPAAGTTRDEDLELALNAALEELARLRRQRPQPDHVLHRESV